MLPRELKSASDIYVVGEQLYLYGLLNACPDLTEIGVTLMQKRPDDNDDAKKIPQTNIVTEIKTEYPPGKRPITAEKITYVHYQSLQALTMKHDEKARVTRQIIHRNCITPARTMTHESLYTKICLLDPLDSFDQLPKEKDENTIFNAILTNLNLQNIEKIDLFTLLFIKGYKFHLAVFFLPPIFDSLLESADGHKILTAIYDYTIENDTIAMSLAVEKQLWKIIINHNNGDLSHVLKSLLKYCMQDEDLKRPNFKRPMELIIDWIYSCKTQNNIIAIFNKITTIIEDSPLKVFKKDFHRVAKQRILMLEFQKSPESKTTPQEEQQKVENFLRYSTSYISFFQTTPYKIYNTLHHGKKQQAINAYKEMTKEIHDNFYVKNKIRV